MRRGDSANTAGLGVTYTRLAFEEALGWVFREQPTEDYGVDAQAEVVEDGDVTGRLLAIQIKSGESWFREPTPSGWWFRPDAVHVRYWTGHTLPVIVVLFDPASKCCYWQHVTQDYLIATSSGGWKLMVPQSQILDVAAVKTLRTLIWHHRGEKSVGSSRPNAGSVVDGRLYISVPFAEKDEAKQCGARWDPQMRMWHVNVSQLRRWLPSTA